MQSHALLFARIVAMVRQIGDFTSMSDLTEMALIRSRRLAPVTEHTVTVNMLDMCMIRSMFTKDMSLPINMNEVADWPRHLWMVLKCVDRPSDCHQLRFAINSDMVMDRESLVILMLIALFQPSDGDCECNRQQILKRRNDYLKLLLW